MSTEPLLLLPLDGHDVHRLLILVRRKRRDLAKKLTGLQTRGCHQATQAWTVSNLAYYSDLETRLTPYTTGVSNIKEERCDNKS